MMRIDYATIEHLIRNDKAIAHVSNCFIDRLTDGINEVLRTGEEKAALEDELRELEAEHDALRDELDTKMAEIVKLCKHPSQHEHEELEMVFVCNICGGLIDNGDFDG
jgi:uncharacterized protein (UPF0335 family)